jgi:hypothetical protein
MQLTLHGCRCLVLTRSRVWANGERQQDGTRLEKCEPHVQEAFRAFSQNWVVVTRQNTAYTKAQPTGTPATIYDLPKETFECETTATPEPAEQEDELLLGSIPHPNAQVLAFNAQKRVSALPIAILLLAPKRAD